MSDALSAPASSTQVVDRTLVNALREALQAGVRTPVDLHETHISWVLLAGEFAYKLKKPVRLPFADFSTLAQREFLCHEEVRLNRRLAEPLYVGVTPICGTPQQPVVGGDGVPIDYVVVMRRFEPGALLSELLAADRLRVASLQQLAACLERFHVTAPVASADSTAGTATVVMQAIHAVLDQLTTGPQDTRLIDIRSWLDDGAAELSAIFEQRRIDRAIRECHGDLHLANAVVYDGRAIAYDCIEFDPLLRWIDVMADVGFMTMDLKAHGRADLAFGFLDAYLQSGGGFAGLRVLRFYEVYRALVRALVSRLVGGPAGSAAGRPASQSAGDTTCAPGDPRSAATDYLGCAHALACDESPRLLITHGFSGSGKSTVTTQLLSLGGAIRIRSDVERKRLFGLSPLDRSASSVDIYSAAGNLATTDRLLRCANQALEGGYPVIVDATFLQAADRRAFRLLAQRYQAPFSILHCVASPQEMRRRVAARAASQNDPSEADLPVLNRQLLTPQELDAAERSVTIEVHTDRPYRPEQILGQWMAHR